MTHRPKLLFYAFAERGARTSDPERALPAADPECVLVELRWLAHDPRMRPGRYSIPLWGASDGSGPRSSQWRRFSKPMAGLVRRPVDCAPIFGMSAARWNFQPFRWF